ncbi:MAG: hypothetical protein P4L63_01385 [Candidatus Pacebacteria bacterium]|nr:hypothetical protein [Candidatus Paceibacterota bacterium]
MNKRLWTFVAIVILVSISAFFLSGFFADAVTYNKSAPVVRVAQTTSVLATAPVVVTIPPLDIALYDKKLNILANNPPDPIVYTTVKTVTQNSKGKSITTITKVPVSPQPVPVHLWPVKTVYPNAGVLLPFNRIVAYYGNLYSTKMGVLGEYPEDQMLQMLEGEVKKWEVADPSTPVIPALQYIAVVAQGSPGASGMYRARMPFSEIDKVIAMAAKINAIVFLDVQVGLSNVQTEVPLLQKYLKMPNVELAIDPEFSMKTGAHPGTVIGTFDATDINFVSNYLANLVDQNNLTPKILVVHRFTEGMITNYKQIKTTPEVQIVMNMDGWGDQAHKIATYKEFIYEEPVQFTGIKLFYKNDLTVPGSAMLTPAQILKLNPEPIYIQYQ